MSAIAKRTFVFLVVMGLVATGGWFGRKAYKRSMERRLTSEAKTYLARKDPRNAALCLQRALQVNPLSPSAAQLMGELLEEVHAPAAVSWRYRAVQLSPKDFQLRLTWAATALKFKDFSSAKTALDGLDTATKSSAAYCKLAGALAWETGRSGEAEARYLQASKLEPANQTIAFNLATIRLASTNETMADAARASLARLATDPALKLNALHYLKADAATHQQVSRALGYSWSIVRDPAVTLRDRLDHLQLLKMANDPGLVAWRSGLESEATGSAPAAFAFGQWLMTVESPTNALRWLRSLPAPVQTNQPVPLILADCYLFLEDWKGLMGLVQKQDWGDGECFRLALRARAERANAEALASRASWTRAVHHAAHHLDRLTQLAQLSAKWGWASEHTELLHEITDEYPDQRWATDALIAELYAAGNSHGLADFLAKSHETDPTNAKLKNNLAAVSLLRRSGLENACRLAREAYDSSPDNPFFMSTYAYALLLQNKTNAAEKIASEIKPQYRQIPSIAAYYGVVEAEAGHKEAAREALQRAQSGQLLPEEKEMVRLASSHL